MRRTRCGYRAAAAAAALLFTLTACGARTVPDGLVAEPLGIDRSPADVEAFEPVASDPGKPTATIDEVAEPSGAAAREAELAEELRGQDEAMNAREHHNRAVRATVARDCVTRGATQVVHVTAPPRAQLSLVVGYADGQAHGAMAIAISGDDGRYDWEIPVAQTVPDGPATVLVGSSGADQGDGGGTGHTRFRVAPAGGC